MAAGMRIRVVALALVTSAPALAQTSGVRHHDGFYAEIALGPSMIRDSFESGEGTVFFERTEGTVTGYGHSQHIAIGGSVAPGLVIAGAAAVDIARTTSADSEGGAVNPDDDYAIITLGPMVDWWFDPDAGFHALLGFGFGATSGVQPEGADGGSASGLGVFAGIGHKWWISDEWGLGALLRVNHVRGTESVVTIITDTYEIEHQALGFALMFSATYH